MIFTVKKEITLYIAVDQLQSTPIPIAYEFFQFFGAENKPNSSIAQPVKVKGKQIKAPNGEEVEIHTYQFCIQSYLPA